MKKYRNLIFLGILVLLSLVIITISSGKGGEFLRRGGTFLFSPFQKLFTFSSQKIERFWAPLFAARKMRGENEELHQKIRDLEGELRGYKEAAAQNKILLELLEYKSNVSYEMVLARIIARDPHNWFHTILLDKGNRDGILPNMPVVNSRGVVGKTVEVTPHTSRVLLLLDGRSGIGAMVEETRNLGVVEGEGNFCLLKYLPRRAGVKEGNAVISSGLGGIFPKGLAIGEISKIERRISGLFQYVEVAPYVDFAKLEEVFIITK
jgi:rod shape-determining protein MreC